MHAALGNGADAASKRQQGAYCRWRYARYVMHGRKAQHDCHNWHK